MNIRALCLGGFFPFISHKGWCCQSILLGKARMVQAISGCSIRPSQILP
ncbi:hypothetical protein LINGRAHAP2_LOCUS15621 [Linum grandiflorum]